MSLRSDYSDGAVTRGIEEDIELESEEIARLAASAAADRNALDIEVLNVGDLLIITDYFVIVSGNSDRQVKAIYNGVDKALRERGVKPIGVEGDREGKWIVIDYASIVVHIFLVEQREYYQLERLWRDAPRLDWENGTVQEA